LERQHSVPLLLPSGSAVAEPLKPVIQQGGGGAVSEVYIQALVHEHPACLPIAEIDAMFSGPAPICTELNKPTTAGVGLRGTSKAASFSVGPPSTAGFGSQGWLSSPVRGCGLPGQNRVTPGGWAE
jgi:hypothetical protein